MEKKSLKIFYKVGIPYSVTINPDDKHQYFGSPNRYNKWKQFMNEMFDQLWNVDCLYEFHAEISEPKVFINNKHPRLHVHGTVIFRTREGIRSFLLTTATLWSRTASIDFDTVSDMTVWNNYCNKQSLFKTRFSNVELEHDYDVEHPWNNLLEYYRYTTGKDVKDISEERNEEEVDHS